MVRVDIYFLWENIKIIVMMELRGLLYLHEIERIVQCCLIRLVIRNRGLYDRLLF